MKIGIIGSGDVGRKLADGLLDLGHQVKLGTRDMSKKENVEWIDKHLKGNEESENALIGDFAEAASFGDDLIVLCTSWNGTSNAIISHGNQYMVSFSGECLKETFLISKNFEGT
jgi:8-hydroxy-5-deazaflavin:NADPH oxidoreductase